MQKSLKEKDQGFTLIELLVVIVIIGILAAIAIPVFLSQREKGVQAGIKSDLKALATAQETYYVDNASYASAVTEADLNFKKTEGNVITLAVNSATKPTAYCIKGTNTGTSTTYWYDSATGTTVESAPAGLCTTGTFN
ncbi:type IV pilin protein [Nocardioides pyridinolyticus]